MKILLTLILIFGTTVTSLSKDWTFELSPHQLKMCSVDGLQHPQYFVDKYGIKNMVNLSFFRSRTFIPPYKDSNVSNLNNPKRWPFIAIENDGIPSIRKSAELNKDTFSLFKNSTRFIAAGYPILLRDGERTRVRRTFFSRRRCPRTAIGIHTNGSIIVYVTTSATLKQVQDYLFTLGCTDAINLDGGSSTFLYVNGKKVYSSNQGRTYPNVLYWE